jgi:small subunit ribosomal protein S18
VTQPKSNSANNEAGYKPRRRWGARYIPRRKVCPFCVSKTTVIDYKDTSKLQHYISDRGRIQPRRRTGICAKHQRALAVAIKRARYIALLPYVPDHIYKTAGST